MKTTVDVKHVGNAQVVGFGDASPSEPGTGSNGTNFITLKISPIDDDIHGIPTVRPWNSNIFEEGNQALAYKVICDKVEALGGEDAFLADKKFNYLKGTQLAIINFMNDDGTPRYYIIPDKNGNIQRTSKGKIQAACTLPIVVFASETLEQVVARETERRLDQFHAYEKALQESKEQPEQGVETPDPKPETGNTTTIPPANPAAETITKTN